MEWKELSNEEKVSRKKRLFYSIANKFRCKSLTSDDLVHEAIIWYYRYKLPEKVSRKVIRYWMIKAIIADIKHRKFLIERKIDHEHESYSCLDYLCNHPRLNKSEQECLSKYYISEMTQTEIAKQKGVSHQRISQIMLKARQKLKNFLKKSDIL